MIDILNLPKDKMKPLFERVVSLKKSEWSDLNIAFHCDINCDHVATILNFARSIGYEFPRASKGRSKNKVKEFPKATDLSKYNKQTPFTRLFTDPNKIIETEPVTKQLHVTKDFWLFKK